jgi:hypothetical protein
MNMRGSRSFSRLRSEFLRLPELGNTRCIGPGGPQRLLTPLWKPPSKAAGPFLCYSVGVQLIGLFLAALLLVVALVGLMLSFLFLRES